MKKLLLLALIVICPAAWAQSNNSGFMYGNDVINPLCVGKLLPGALIQQRATADLATCQKEFATKKIDMNFLAGYYTSFSDDNNPQAGSQSYKIIGQTNNGIYLIAFQTRDGTAKKDENVFLLHMKNEHAFYQFGSKNEKTDFSTAPFKVGGKPALELIGSIKGGDRCEGDFSNIKIHNNDVMLNRYEGTNTPFDCSKTKDYVLDVTGLK